MTSADLPYRPRGAASRRSTGHSGRRPGLRVAALALAGALLLTTTNCGGAMASNPPDTSALRRAVSDALTKRGTKVAPEDLNVMAQPVAGADGLTLFRAIYREGGEPVFVGGAHGVDGRTELNPYKALGAAFKAWSGARTPAQAVDVARGVGLVLGGAPQPAQLVLTEADREAIVKDASERKLVSLPVLDAKTPALSVTFWWQVGGRLSRVTATLDAARGRVTATDTAIADLKPGE